MPGIKRIGKNLALVAALTLVLSGCVHNATPGDWNSNRGDDDYSGPSKPTMPIEPDETPTPTPIPSSPSDDENEENDPIEGDVGDHEHSSEEQIASASLFVKSFVGDLTNRELSPEEWRDAVVPFLYSNDMKELYSTLDANSVPFCTAVGSVELGALGTFSNTFSVYFKDSTSKLIIEVMDMSEMNDGSNYMVLNMNPVMNDSGGC